MELCKIEIWNLFGVKSPGTVACNIVVDAGELQRGWAGSCAPSRYHQMLMEYWVG